MQLSWHFIFRYISDLKKKEREKHLFVLKMYTRLTYYCILVVYGCSVITFAQVKQSILVREAYICNFFVLTAHKYLFFALHAQSARLATLSSQSFCPLFHRALYFPRHPLSSAESGVSHMLSFFPVA